MSKHRAWWFVGALVLCTPAAALAVPQFLGSWDMPPAPNWSVSVPYCVAVAPDDHVYVTDQVAYRVCKFTRTGTLVGTWGGFTFPLGIAVAPDGRVYVVDHALATVSVFDGGGAFLFRFGSRGSGPGQFNAPRDITTDPEGNLYVADYGNHRVQKFTDSGAFVQIIGTEVLLGPTDLVVSPDGDLFVTDESGLLNRVTRFSPGGEVLAHWGGSGSGPLQFNGPGGICMTAFDRHLFVVDHGNSRIQELSDQGAFLSMWNTTNAGMAIGDVLDIAANRHGELYVTDAVGRRVLRFVHTPTSAMRSSWGALKARFR